MNNDQQTFSPAHWETLVNEVKHTELSTIEMLYRASYSATFGADFRAAIEEAVTLKTVERWES